VRGRRRLAKPPFTLLLAFTLNEDAKAPVLYDCVWAESGRPASRLKNGRSGHSLRSDGLAGTNVKRSLRIAAGVPTTSPSSARHQHGKGEDGCTQGRGSQYHLRLAPQRVVRSTSPIRPLAMGPLISSWFRASSPTSKLHGTCQSSLAITFGSRHWCRRQTPRHECVTQLPAGHLGEDPTFGWLLGYPVPESGAIPADGALLFQARLLRDCHDVRTFVGGESAIFQNLDSSQITKAPQ
jgi:hypothetical protein